jgi:hypothetical protein
LINRQSKIEWIEIEASAAARRWSARAMIAIDKDAAEYHEQIDAGLPAHTTAALYYSHFSRSCMLLHERLVQCTSRFVGSRTIMCG